jgi:hypothetical protein
LSAQITDNNYEERTTTMPDYFLSDDIYVEAGPKAKKFEKLIKRATTRGGIFQDLFAPFKWELKLALKGTKPLRYNPPKVTGSEKYTLDVRSDKRNGVRCERYLHIWNVPDPPDVAGVMQQLADSRDYSDINDLVFEEVQNQVLNVELATDDRFALKDTFVVVRQQLSTAYLGTHLYNANILQPLMEAKGWRNFGRFQSITGYLNSIMQIWQVPAAQGSQDHAAKALALPSKTALGEVAAQFDSTARAEWRDTMKAYVAL